MLANVGRQPRNSPVLSFQSYLKFERARDVKLGLMRSLSRVQSDVTTNHEAICKDVSPDCKVAWWAAPDKAFSTCMEERG